MFSAFTEMSLTKEFLIDVDTFNQATMGLTVVIDLRVSLSESDSGLDKLVGIKVVSTTSRFNALFVVLIVAVGGSVEMIISTDGLNDVGRVVSSGPYVT